MPFIILLFCPLIVSAIGGGFITDDNKGKRTLGFVLVAIAAIGVIIQIAVQIVNPVYYL